MKRPEHMLSIVETPTPRLTAILSRAISLRRSPEKPLADRTLCCIFEKASLRTRVSFEQAARKLGGAALTLSNNEIGVGARESPQDIARVLSGMVDVVAARVKEHWTLEAMASASTIPIVNGLSDLEHPAQALADVLTMADEFSPGDIHGLRGRTLAFVGDGNNVARSLAASCARLGMTFVICSPRGYELDEAWVRALCRSVPGADIQVRGDPREAVCRADAIYCDTFVSMGQEHERTERLNAFSRFQVNESLVACAPGHAIILHCLPASRGVEITDGVMDSPQSRVFPQSANRVDAQMGLLAEIFDPTR